MEAVLVTGSRGWVDQTLIRQIVSTYELVIVGCANGADAITRAAARDLGCMLRVFTADWASEPRRAGIIRNGVMVNFALELALYDGILVHCHAFWDGSSPGTRHCASLARRAGFPTTTHIR